MERRCRTQLVKASLGEGVDLSLELGLDLLLLEELTEFALPNQTGSASARASWEKTETWTHPRLLVELLEALRSSLAGCRGRHCGDSFLEERVLGR